MKQNNRFFIFTVILAMVALLSVTGCNNKEPKMEERNDNRFWMVGNDFINGYGKDYCCVYVETVDRTTLFAICDATETSVFNEYGKGLYLPSSFAATGVYLPLKMEQRDCKALLSYGDIAPVTLKKNAERVYSVEDFGSLSFYPVEFIGYKDYADAMKEYGQTYDDFDNVSNCWCYEVTGEKIEVFSTEEAPNGGVYYNIDELKPGLYLVNDSYGIVKITK